MIERHEVLLPSIPVSVPTDGLLQLLCTVSAELTHCESPIRFVDLLFQRLTAHLPVDCYCQYTLDPATQKLKLVSYNGLSEEDAALVEQLAIPSSLLDRIDAEGDLVLFEQQPDELHDALEATLRLKASLVFPLRANRRLFGLLMFGAARAAGFQPSDIAVLQAIAHQVAAAIERRRMRSQLELERDSFNALMDNIPAGILLAEAPSGRIVLGNTQVKEMLGGGALDNSLLSPTSAVLTEGDDAPVARALRGEAVQGDEYLHQRADGSTTWIRASSSPIRDRNGRIIGSVVTCYDIDQEKRAEAALRESEERFRMLADASPQIVWAADAAGRVDYMNQKWFDTTGLTPEQTYSSAARATVLHPDDLDRTRQAWYDAVKSGEPMQMETRYRDSSGEYRWHLIRAIPVRDAEGAIIRWLGTSTDIDDQKRAEEALRQADRSKDEFLAMLGHELRNPLAAIVNAASLLEYDGLDAESIKQAREIMARQLGNMTRMLDDLLDIARVKQGKVKLQREHVNLVEIVRRASATSEPYLKSRSHQFALDLPKDEEIWFEADPTRLEQVIVNLLNNAAKYTEPGGKIWLKLRKKGGEAHLSVRDTGIGMTRETLTRAFELFAQADRSSSQSQGGLGVGLSMVKSLVNMHGGYVRAYSNGLGHGSEITVVLPLDAV